MLAMIARHGRFALVAGLVAGIALPDLALALRPAIAPLIVALLFIAVLRLGPAGVAAGITGLPRATGLVLVLQLILPMLAVGLFHIAGVIGHPVAMGIVLALAAAPITGSANITLMTGGDPAPALRQMVVGTALLPLTAMPVFLAMPAFGAIGVVAWAALELLALIAIVVIVGLALHRWRIVTSSTRSHELLDILSAALLGLVVVGIMSAVGPALTGAPSTLLLAFMAACALNVGMQVAFSALAAIRAPAAAPAIGIVAGNRNIALFLGILPPDAVDTVLLFVGCMQIPMYLTPFLLAGWYRRVQSA